MAVKKHKPRTGIYIEHTGIRMVVDIKRSRAHSQRPSCTGNPSSPGKKNLRPQSSNLGRTRPAPSTISSTPVISTPPQVWVTRK